MLPPLSVTQTRRIFNGETAELAFLIRSVGDCVDFPPFFFCLVLLRDLLLKVVLYMDREI